uniref:beta-soluble NSF attachment protein n=1 Tax=Panthera onca TaxID=9690 RepID=UPI00295461D6|nr:beta-soluble NSF attachment protein [Panthera onca]
MDSAGKEREAVQLMAEAEKRVKASHSFLRGLFGGNTKIEEACEMYTRAANMFKMAKNWSGMYKVFVYFAFQANNFKIILKEEITVCISYCWLRCVLHKPLHCTSSQQKPQQHLVGANTMDNPLLKYSAKDYFFKAALCHFIVDELNAKLALEKYEEMFPAFTDSRECKLLKKLLEAHEEQNSEAYTEAVKEFDSISRLDQWLTTMLLRIKKSIQGDGEGDGDLK